MEGDCVCVMSCEAVDEKLPEALRSLEIKREDVGVMLAPLAKADGDGVSEGEAVIAKEADIAQL